MKPSWTEAILRQCFRFAAFLMYRIRVTGRENLPLESGALLVANHVTWLDGILLYVSAPRPVRMIADAEFVFHPKLRWLARVFRVIPITATSGPRALLKSLDAAREAIRNGDLVCIFAEGQLTRTGQLQPLQRGLLKIIDGTDAPLIPAYLDNLWGSVFSFRGGKYFWKWPRKLMEPISVLFGQPIAASDVATVRQSLLELNVQAIEQRKERSRNLPREFLRNCRRSLFRSKVADSIGQNLTGGQLLLRTLIARRLLNRAILERTESMVGVLLPPSAGGAIINAALTLAGRIPINLNYTSSPASLNACLERCGVQRVLTSRLFISRLKLELKTTYVYLEELKDQLTVLDKLIAVLQAFVVPIFLLERWFGLTRLKADDTLTVIFTSGSTGEPKGVVLSLHNVASNIDAMNQLFRFEKTDVLMGVLPFFHSFGFTGTLWSALSLKPKVVYHFNPLEARQIGELCGQHRVSILLSTPTFLRSYVKRCEPEQLQHLRLVITGAEKLPADLANSFEEKFRVRAVEAYGATELSPLAAINVPDFHAAGINQIGTKPGTVGRPIPGTSAKIIDPETEAPCAPGTPGMLLIKGPQVMQGYLHQPEATAKVVRDGWYVTGDIARIDEDGFIQITDRLSRFSKIGGEMVPHILIEEQLARIVSEGPDDTELKIVVTAVPDTRKGERLIVVHKPLKKSLDQVSGELAASGLPNLWIPSRDSYLEVAEMPVLGTGKLDLLGLKSLALRAFPSEGASVSPMANPTGSVQRP